MSREVLTSLKIAKPGVYGRLVDLGTSPMDGGATGMHEQRGGHPKYWRGGGGRLLKGLHRVLS